MPPSVATRWNSLALGLEAMLKMKDAFRHIKETQRPQKANDVIDKFLQRIPLESEMHILDIMVPVLTVIRLESDKLSADKTPTAQLVMPSLFNIAKAIENVSFCFVKSNK